MENGKVGVVIPIFGVENYLRECVDSVLNQTYENLSIMLVCDDDPACLEISLEYLQKDCRIIVIDKENGGLSRNRNVGIDFYANKYELVATDSINAYKVTNANPYHIRHIYVNNGGGGGIESNIESKLEIPCIHHIIFLDSDDYWQPNLIACCLDAFADAKSQHINVQFVWFDYSTIYDGIKEQGQWSRQQHLGYYHTQIINTQDFLQNFLDKHITEFAFAWAGLINFEFVKSTNLYFLDGAASQDVLFGIMLILKSDYMYILAKKLLVYRMRPHSASNFEGENNINTTSVYPFIRNIYEGLYRNARLTRGYYKASSWYYMYAAAQQFLDSYKASGDVNKIKKAQIVKRALMTNIATKAAQSINYPKDPLNIIPHMREMRSDVCKDDLSMAQRLAIFHYGIYRILQPFFRLDMYLALFYPRVHNALHKTFSTLKSLLKMPLRLGKSIVKRIKKLKKFL